MPTGVSSPAALASLGGRVLLPAAQAVRFRQIQFAFASGPAPLSDWGQFEADTDAVRAVLGAAGGYVNVVLHTPGQAAPAWVVENLRVAPAAAGARDAATLTALAAEGLTDGRAAVPMNAAFDLRPGVRGSGPLSMVTATVVVTPGPLPPVDRIWKLLRQVPPAAFAVTPVLNNAEGGLDGRDSRLPRTVNGGLALGDPPQPRQAGPEGPTDLAAAIEIYQAEQPNLHAAKNQCMPMAMSNVIGYLRLRYNKPPSSWPLPHQSSPGIGMTQSVGDVIFWQAAPAVSRMAQIDARTRRSAVYDFDSGGGSNKCQYMPATFSYFTTQGVPGMVSFRHQGSDAVIGAGNSCDNGDPTLPLGGYTSTREGSQVTWDWIYQQLQAGRGVMISFARYDASGAWVGGHGVRVWGARRFAGRNTIYTLDDGNQGLNNDGLRTEQWELTDLDTPGAPGVPNGRLEMSGLPWEITFAVSVEAKPTPGGGANPAPAGPGGLAP